MFQGLKIQNQKAFQGEEMGFPAKTLLSLMLILLIPAFSIHADAGSNNERETHTRRLLVIHSYHEGYPWTDSMTAGIQDIFEGKAEYSLSFFHLDALNRPVNSLGLAHLSWLSARYSGEERPDAVLAVDDDAFRFMLGPGADLFPGTALLYCGINDPDSYAQDALNRASGIPEVPDIAGTIRLARSLIGNPGTLAVVADRSTAGQLNLERYRQLPAETLSGFSELVLDDLEPSSLTKALASLPPGSAVLYLSYLVLPDGSRLSLDKSLKLVAEAGHAPVFACWDFVVQANGPDGLGAVGGVVVSGRNHGRAAASLAIEVLEGRTPATGYRQPDPGHAVMMDYRRMKARDLDPGRLPEGVIVLGAPVPVAPEVRFMLASMLAVIILGLFVFFHLVRSRRHTREAEFRYRMLAEQVPAIVYMLELGEPNRMTYISPRIKTDFGFEPAAWLNQPALWWERVHPEDRELAMRTIKETDQLVKSLPPETQGTDLPSKSIEYRIACRDGSYRWIRSRWAYSRGPAGTLLALGFIYDIDADVQREQVLQDALAERDTLLREVHHRVKNNFQIISSLLRLESGSLVAGPAISALENANRRVFAMSLVHELLYQEDLSGALELGHYLERLATALLGEAEGLQISLSVQGEKLEIPLDTAVPLGLVCNEALMNILRHAFPPEHRENPRVDIQMERLSRTARISIRDNGIGPGHIVDQLVSRERSRGEAPPSLGLTLVEALTSQIDGTWSIRHDGGTVVSLEFPLP
jgi:two-component sensor histidine kinase/PAS domain-containing protein